MYDVLNSALNKVCPKIEVKSTVKSADWITDEHVQKKSEVSRLYKTAKALSLIHI